MVQISYDGRRIASVPLSQKTERDDGAARYCLILYDDEAVCRWYETRPDIASVIPKGKSYNLLVISESRVFMENADCRDQICVHHKPISDGRESIICLPHRLVVEIVGGTTPEGPDRIVRTDEKIIREEGRRGHEEDG